MALDYTALQAVTQDYIVPYLQDNVFNETPVLQRLRSKMDKSQDGGTQIQQPIIYAKKTSMGTYSGWGTILTTMVESLTAVTYSWGHYYVTMGINRTDELSNAGKVKIISLISAETETAKKTMAFQLTTDLFASAAVTNGLSGLIPMCHTTTEFGGISSSDTSVWAASRDASSTVMTIGALQGQYGNQTDGNDHPTLIITNQDMFDKYYTLLEIKPEFRVQNDNNTLKFQGADWVVDALCPGTGSGTADNHLFMLNENYIQFYQHPQDNMTIGEWQKPINQMGRIAEITWSGQLGTSNRRRQGVITTINPAL